LIVNGVVGCFCVGTQQIQNQTLDCSGFQERQQNWLDDENHGFSLNSINTLVPIAVTFQSCYSTLKLAKPSKHFNVFSLDVLMQNHKPVRQIVHSSG
jgi:hypothetical protein